MHRLFFFIPYILLHITICNAQEYEKVNLGPKVNSKYDEASPLVSPDGLTLYFVRSDHPENTFGPNSQDIWYSKYNKETEEWSMAKRLGHPFNQQRFNAICGISPDGTKILIKGAYQKGKYKDRGFSIVRKKRNGWAQPEQLLIKDLQKMNKGFYYGGFLSNDGKVLLIYMSETKDDMNCSIYVSFLHQNNTWSRPLNLGKQINQGSMNAAPFLASDGITLYFSSARPGGAGDADIYKSKRLDDTWTNWSRPENLGTEINTKDRETYYSLSASGEYAFLTSSAGSIGKGDLVKVKLKDENRPEPVVLVKGHVLNAINKEAIEATIVYEVLETAVKAGEASSDPEAGAYAIILTKGMNYGITATAKGYAPVSENLDLTNLETFEEIKKDLFLIPIEEGQTIRLNNIFFELNSAELKKESYAELSRLTEMLQKNRSMKIEIAGHTDNSGNEQYNLDLSQKRAESVRTHLISNKISPERVKAKGYGAAKPIGDNLTEEGKAMNRRVEFIIISK